MRCELSPSHGPAASLGDRLDSFLSWLLLYVRLLTEEDAAWYGEELLLGPSPAGRPKISRVNSLNFWPCPEAKVGLEVSTGGSSPCFAG